MRGIFYGGWRGLKKEVRYIQFWDQYPNRPRLYRTCEAEPREEYFANLTEFEAFIPGLYGNRTRIERMSKSSAREAIVNPCKVCNVGIEDGQLGTVKFRTRFEKVSKEEWENARRTGTK